MVIGLLQLQIRNSHGMYQQGTSWMKNSMLSTGITARPYTHDVMPKASRICLSCRPQFRSGLLFNGCARRPYGMKEQARSTGFMPSATTAEVARSIRPEAEVMLACVQPMACNSATDWRVMSMMQEIHDCTRSGPWSCHLSWPEARAFGHELSSAGLMQSNHRLFRSCKVSGHACSDADCRNGARVQVLAPRQLYKKAAKYPRNFLQSS